MPPKTATKCDDDEDDDGLEPSAVSHKKPTKKNKSAASPPSHKKGSAASTAVSLKGQPADDKDVDKMMASLKVKSAASTSGLKEYEFFFSKHENAMDISDVMISDILKFLRRDHASDLSKSHFVKFGRSYNWRSRINKRINSKTNHTYRQHIEQGALFVVLLQWTSPVDDVRRGAIAVEKGLNDKLKDEFQVLIKDGGGGQFVDTSGKQYVYFFSTPQDVPENAPKKVKPKEDVTSLPINYSSDEEGCDEEGCDEEGDEEGYGCVVDEDNEDEDSLEPVFS